VDNRAEAPSRTPGDGSGSSKPDENSEVPAGANGANGQAPSDAAVKTESAATRPSTVSAPAGAPLGGPDPAPLQATGSRPSSTPAGQSSAPAGQSSAPAGQSSAPAGQSAGGTGSGNTSPMAAVSSVASGARDLAAKVGSSFSGFAAPKTQPRPKGQPRPRGQQVRRPASGARAGQTRPQQNNSVRPQSGAQPTRSAQLSLQRVEPMSVMKFSFLISLVGWVVLFVAVAVIYFTLSKLGVFTKIEQTIGLVTYNKNHPGSNASSWFSAARVLEYTALVCTINAILFTALATVGAALYNLVTSLTGGIEVTLRESD